MSGRREIVRVSPNLVVSRDFNPEAHADPEYRGGYLLLLPGKVPEIVLDGLSTAAEQQEAEMRCLQKLEQRNALVPSVVSGMGGGGSGPNESRRSIGPRDNLPGKGLIGQRLVAAGLLTVENLQKMLERQKALPPDRPVRRLGSLLIEVNLLTVRQVSEALAQQRGVQTSISHSARVDPAVVDLFPREVLSRLQAVPICLVGKTVGVAMADPHEQAQVDELQALTHYSVRPMLAPQVQVQKLLDDMRHLRRPRSSAGQTLPPQGPSRDSDAPASQSVQGLSLVTPEPAAPRSPVPAVPGSNKSLVMQLASQGSRASVSPKASGGSVSPKASGGSVSPKASGGSSPGVPQASQGSVPSGPMSARSSQRSTKQKRLPLGTRTERTMWLVAALVAITVAVSAGFWVKLHSLSRIREESVAQVPGTPVPAPPTAPASTPPPAPEVPDEPAEAPVESPPAPSE